MLRKLYNHLFCQPRMARRVTVAAVSNIVIGMCIAFFEKVQVGTDPCTVFNLSVVQNMLHWESLGRWQLIFNGTLVLILFLLKEARHIGLGSLCNMVLVGYSRDFFRPIVQWMFPGEVTSLVIRGAVFVPGLILFMLGVSFYIVVELGESPYDALCQVISNHLPQVPYSVVRICYDLIVTGVGFLLGGTVGIFTVASCIFLGPMISAIAAKFRPWFQ